MFEVFEVKSLFRAHYCSHALGFVGYDAFCHSRCTTISHLAMCTHLLCKQKD